MITVPENRGTEKAIEFAVGGLGIWETCIKMCKHNNVNICRFVSVS